MIGKPVGTQAGAQARARLGAGRSRALALALLRMGLMVALVQCHALLSGWAEWLPWLGVPVVVGLGAGLFTRCCAGAAAGLMLLVLGQAGVAAVWSMLPDLMCAAAVALLGGGPWSLDMALFGRRLVFSSDDSFG